SKDTQQEGAKIFIPIASTFVFVIVGFLAFSTANRSNATQYLAIGVLIQLLLLGSSLFRDTLGEVLGDALFYVFFYGPLIAFLLLQKPWLYLLHILCFSLHSLVKAVKARSRERGGWDLFVDYMLCLTMSIFGWLSLKYIEGNPLAALIDQADRLGLDIVRA